MKKNTFTACLMAAILLTGCTGAGKTANNSETNADPTPQQSLVAQQESAPQPATPAEAPTATEDEEEEEYEGYTSEEVYREEVMPLYAPLKVKGAPDIQSFVKALPLFSPEYDWLEDHLFDKKNGYFALSEEGSGHVAYHGAIWNRTDGKKLFIFSFDSCDWFEHEGHTETYCLHGGSKYFYGCAYAYAPEESHTISFIDYYTGCVAYLYNPDTKTLEPLPEPPFNNWDVITNRCQFILPQKGKDITVEIGFDEDITTHTLKWNGMTFDYIP